MSDPTWIAVRRAPARVALLPVLVVAFAMPRRLAPQEPVRGPAASSLTLRAVYDAVDAANPAVRAARARAEAVAARRPGASRPADPTLQLGLMNYLLPDAAPDPALGMRQLQLMQMVPLPGKLGAAAEGASERAIAAGHRVEEARLTARASAAMAFLDLWGAARQAGIARETRRLLEDASAIAASMYRGGDRPQSDVLRAQVEVSRMDEMVLRMQAMAEVARIRLAAVLDTSPQAIPAMVEAPALARPLPATDSLVALALAARPMLAAGRADAAAAAADARLARRERWPDPQLGIQLASRGTPMGTERMGSLMVGASIPVWARDRQRRMQDEAAAMRVMAEAELAAMRADTRGRVGAAHATIASDRRLAAHYRGTLLPQAEAAAASALAAYRSGAVDFMTVIDHRMTVNTYRQALAGLEQAEAAAWVELEMLLGRALLVPDGGM